jgi:hypothetical protein
MPSPAYSKSKGRLWENAIVAFLDEMIAEETERRRLSGVNDKGDIAGIRNVVIEAKNERTYKIPEWIREAVREAGNARADLGVVWFRLNGKPKARDGVVVMRPQDFLMLLAKAGYVTLADVDDGPVSSSETL